MVERQNAPNALPTLLRDAIDDERLYQARFRASDMGGTIEPPADVLQAHVEDEAERIERTVGCVTAVVQDERDKTMPSDYYTIILYAILPRHIDTGLFDRLISESRHRAMEAAHEEMNQR